jgi:hypothetical protein
VTFKDAIAAATKDALAGDLDHYLGQDWFQLTSAEEFVFGIDPFRFPALVTAYQAYLVFMTVVDSDEYDHTDIDAERKRPDLFTTFADSDGKLQPDVSLTSFQNFCKEYTDVTFREAHAMYGKYEFWAVRSEITRYRDEPGE